MGVNPKPSLAKDGGKRIPHACGGEPQETKTGDVIPSVFPTHVGVNRNLIPFPSYLPEYSPRMWG